MNENPEAHTVCGPFTLLNLNSTGLDRRDGVRRRPDFDARPLQNKLLQLYSSAAPLACLWSVV